MNETIHQEPVSSSTPENERHKTLTVVEQDEQQNGEMSSDDDDELELQDNFSFLIAKGMLKPASS